MGLDACPNHNGVSVKVASNLYWPWLVSTNGPNDLPNLLEFWLDENDMNEVLSKFQLSKT